MKERKESDVIGKPTTPKPQARKREPGKKKASQKTTKTTNSKKPATKKVTQRTPVIPKPLRTKVASNYQARDLRTTIIEQLADAKPELLTVVYLNRLRRLLRLRRDHLKELNEPGLRLLDRSIFAAYCDCLDIGQGKAAKAVLRDIRLTLSDARVRSQKYQLD